MPTPEEIEITRDVLGIREGGDNPQTTALANSLSIAKWEEQLADNDLWLQKRDKFVVINGQVSIDPASARGVIRDRSRRRFGLPPIDENGFEIKTTGNSTSSVVISFNHF